ncbi:MAG: hypothetical protein PHG87_07480 [Candidatus Omnitrophica bacterium]|nr:hypothetical protein [Candidatus Omnitrophota bacterium]
MKTPEEMSEDELRVLKARVDNLLGNNNKSSRDIVFMRYILELASEPPSSVAAPSLCSCFDKGYPHLMEFIESIGPLDNRQKLIAMKMCANLIVGQLREMDIPVSVKTICNCMQRIRDIFDRAFPGYIESGLVGFVYSVNEQNGES